jgi:predicted secreted protein
MIRRGLFAALAALISIIPVFAGDIATFANLGFSPDSAYFMFGQYGVDSSTSKPWAELYLVDTRKNDFVVKGQIRRIFDARLEAGQSPEGALFALFAESASQARSLKIDHLATGRLIYVLIDGQEVPQNLSFRDFKTEASWEISMNKSILEDKSGPKSSFGLSVSVTSKDGGVRRVTAGNPEIKRAGVKDYIIRRAIIAPDEKTLVLIIEKQMAEKGDQSVRYMIETLKLP